MLVECNDINLLYPDTKTCVFKDLTCTISGPGFNALFGPSGVGKTTLAKMIAGAISGFSGTITATGMSTVLYSYNLERLPGWCSVGEHLEEVAASHAKEKTDELVIAFGLEECLGARFAQLSLGQQNRTNLTRYLLQEFDVLIMDESLANVDEVTREQIILKIKEIYPDKCFVYISHNVAEVSRFCRQIIVLRGPNRAPQAVSVQGQDHRGGGTVNRKALGQTVLEIMHVS